MSIKAKDLSRLFSTTLEDYFLKLVELDAERMDFQPADGKWSGKELLGHLIDSATNNHRRFVISPNKEDMIFDGYDQDAWVETQNYKAKHWNDILNLWHLYNCHLVHVVASLSDDVLNKKYKKHNLDKIAFELLPKSKSASLAYLIQDYINHMIYHLEQIIRR